MDKLMKQVGKMDPEEVEKLRKLLDEKTGSRKEKNDDSGAKVDMTWMYKEDKPDRDEYLMGRRVDKHIEDEGKVEENKDAPGASFEEVIARRADIDMHAKMREDPLYAIRKQEEESRKKLMTNPIKMKQLEKLIREKEKLSKKKQKKKKKKRDSSSDSDSGDDLLNKYLEIKRKKEMKALKHSIREDRDAPRDREKGHSKHDSHKHDKERENRKHDDRYDERRRDRERVSPRRQSPSHHHGSTERSRSDRHDRHNREHGEGRYGLISKGSHSEEQRSSERSKSHKSSRRSRSRSRSPRKDGRSNDRQATTKRSYSPPAKSRSKLSSEEMARRRAEMLDNAKLRDDEREQNVKRYKAEMDCETEDFEKKGASADFLNSMMIEHVSKLSVEERIKRNKYNVQRTTADLDKNFTKR